MRSDASVHDVKGVVGEAVGFGTGGCVGFEVGDTTGASVGAGVDGDVGAGGDVSHRRTYVS